MLIRECLHRAPVTVPPECTLEEASRLMAGDGVGCVVVMSGGRLRGIVTDRDIVVRGVAAGRSLSAPVRTVMSEHPLTIDGSADVIQAYRLLREASVRRLPVLEDGELAGVVTVDDLLVGLVLELASVLSPVAHEVMEPRLG